MNGYYVIGILLALVISGTFVLRKKKNFKVTGPLALFHTKQGIRIIEKIANKAPRFWKGFSTFGIGIGFIAMFYIFYALLKNTILIFTTKGAVAGAVPVIPGVTIPFWVGIIGLITVLVFHEMSHGIIAQTEKIKLKSVGLASLGFLPIGAFVEPDEKQLKNAKTLSQLRMYVAGSFMNFIIAILAFLLLIFVLVPTLTTFIPGAHIVTVDDGGPAQIAGLQDGAVLTTFSGTPVESLEGFTEVTKDLKPGQVITLDTDQGSFPITLGEKNGRGYIGIQAVICSKTLVNPLCYKPHSFVPKSVFWFGVGAFNWIVILNLGIGLFNLLPLKPFDGGLMVEAITKRKAPALSKILVRGLSAISLLMIIINLAGPYIL
jgi:membrane-associated protease RseP (regulator of RpoE activity)